MRLHYDDGKFIADDNAHLHIGSDIHISNGSDLVSGEDVLGRLHPALFDRMMLHLAHPVPYRDNEESYRSLWHPRFTPRHINQANAAAVEYGKDVLKALGRNVRDAIFGGGQDYDPLVHLIGDIAAYGLVEDTNRLEEIARSVPQVYDYGYTFVPRTREQYRHMIETLREIGNVGAQKTYEWDPWRLRAVDEDRQALAESIEHLIEGATFPTQYRRLAPEHRRTLDTVYESLIEKRTEELKETMDPENLREDRLPAWIRAWNWIVSEDYREKSRRAGELDSELDELHSKSLDYIAIIVHP